MTRTDGIPALKGGGLPVDVFLVTVVRVVRKAKLSKIARPSMAGSTVRVTFRDGYGGQLTRQPAVSARKDCKLVESQPADV